MDNIIERLRETEQWLRTLEKHELKAFGITASIRTVLLSAGLASFAAYAVSRYIIYQLYLNPVNKLPGPPVDRWVPFAGNMREIIREEAGVPHKKWAEKYGDVLVYHGPWNQPRVLVSSPTLLKQILTIQQYDFEKPPQSTEFLSRVLGRGLLVAEGDVHRHQRKMLNPAFAVQALRDIVPMMAVPVVRLCDKWRQEIKASGQELTDIEVSYGLSLATLDVIGLAGFGQDFHSVEFAGTDKHNKLSRGYLTIFTPRTNSLWNVLTFFFPILRKVPTRRNLEFWQALRWIKEESRAVVERGIERAEKDKKSNNILAVMIKETEESTGERMTVEELQNQCLTFLAAGHETTSVVLSWCLWLLAQHQDVQDALRQEVAPVIKKMKLNHPIFTKDLSAPDDLNEANIPSYDVINSLHLLNNVCKETMRLIPPVPMTNRISVKDVVLNSHFIPKGTVFFIPIVLMHHSRQIWGDDATEFKPSRWDEELASKIGPYEYMPFLAGGRQCIGNRFALTEMKILLAILITKFQFFEKPGFEVVKKQFVTLRPSPNMTLRVKSLF